MRHSLGERFEVVEDWSPNGAGGKPLKAGMRFTLVGGKFDFLGDGNWTETEIELEDGTTREVLAPPHDPALKVRPLRKRKPTVVTVHGAGES
jgi:hypothetical protein